MNRFLATCVGALVPVVLIAGPAAAGGNGDGGQPMTGTQNSQGTNQGQQHDRGDSWDWTVQGH